MRLLQIDESGTYSLTEDLIDDIPAYAILSHTWGKDSEEVTLNDFRTGAHVDKVGYRKIQFCGKQAVKDDLRHFWVDTCCIDKANFTELNEAINSMFKWYQEAAKCYVYLPDVSTGNDVGELSRRASWETKFRNSRWFTRAWTLQELIAPNSVEFFSQESERLGDKRSLEQSLHEITGVTVDILRGRALAEISIEERLLWAEKRTAKRKEDEAYSLLGIFDLQMPLIYGEGRANAFKRLEEEIQKRLKGTTLLGNTHWMVPRTTNKLFTGRSSLLQRIQTALQKSSITSPPKQRTFVITGLGGQGKSELCLQVASLMKQQFWGVFWIDVDTPSSAKRDFLAVASLLGSSAETISDVLQILSNIRESWLLILDNGDDPAYDYSDYFPSGTHGAVLMTSRVAECRLHSPDAFEALEGLHEREACQLLLKAANVTPELWSYHVEQALDVVRLLGSHTLALVQAGAYISQGHCNLLQYPDIYQIQRQRLMQFRPKQAKSRYGDVYATFEASAEILENSTTETAKDALDLLNILSMLDSGALSFQVFEEAWRGSRYILTQDDADLRGRLRLSHMHVSMLPDFLMTGADKWDYFRLTEAAILLGSLSLVTRHNANDYSNLSMHPLAHSWSQDRLNLESQNTAWLAAGCVLGFSRLEGDLWDTHVRTLLPHLLFYLDIKLERAFEFATSAVVLPLILSCGSELDWMRQDSRLDRLLRETFSELKQEPGNPTQEFMPLYRLQATNLNFMANSHEAIALLQRILSVDRLTLPKTDVDRLRSQTQLGSAYCDNEQLEDGMALLESLIKMYETFPETDEDRLCAQHILGLAYLENKQVVLAIALLEEVVKIREETLPETDANRQTSQLALASAFRKNGQVAEAVAAFERILNIQERTLAETHPNRLSTEHELARSYLKNGDVDEAVSLLEHVNKIEGTTLADTNPNRLATRSALARAYKRSGRLAEAVALFEKVVEVRRSVLPAGHPRLVSAEKALASCMRAVHRQRQTL
ncbi:hypothetical protein VTL71DRAFT_10417 [Oculimacula yallundae]|uniref:Heterokaryon incompatibility domain-containing protein n=1 Tax=Oculimacula yallundae TaxID=86028 RepID=A0ABR4CTJ2_9HELO